MAMVVIVEEEGMDNRVRIARERENENEN